MIYLSGHASAVLDELPDVGLMLTPASSYRIAGLDLERRLWALDTGVAGGAGWDFASWMGYLAQLVPYRETCLFVSAPDRWGQGHATYRDAQLWCPLIERMGFPAALVLQPGWGVEQLQPEEWLQFSGLFIGGIDVWQTSDAVQRWVAAAHEHGKWVHRGRVNSLRKLRQSQLWGVDSCDGTYLAFGPRKNAARLGGWLGQLTQQPPLLAA